MPCACVWTCVDRVELMPCVCVCARARVRVFARAYVWSCVCSRVCVCGRVCDCVRERVSTNPVCAPVGLATAAVTAGIKDLRRGGQGRSVQPDEPNVVGESDVRVSRM